MTKQQETKSYCSKCNRCLTDDKGTTIMGLKITLEGLDKYPKIREQLGKYAPKGNCVVFNFCYECWLDSLFINSPYFEGWSK